MVAHWQEIFILKINLIIIIGVYMNINVIVINEASLNNLKHNKKHNFRTNKPTKFGIDYIRGSKTRI